MGTFLLGSTSPDIRAITRGERQEYHFAPLDFGPVGAGVEGLFRAHPGLSSDAVGDGATQAFVAGYVSHIVADELWIVDMFRPYFGNRQVFEDKVVGLVMDRVFQLELDRQARDAVNATLAELQAATDSIDVGFISSETLGEWRDWVVPFLGREFSWDRLRFMARRIAGRDDGHPAHAVASDFLEAIPANLDRLYGSVPYSQLESFKQNSVRVLARFVGDYLP